MEKITKEIIIGDLLDANPGAAEILLKAGMHCLGCPSARGETLEEASMIHGMDIDVLVDEINAFIESNK